MKPIYGLGIESSCDETALAVLKDGREIISQPLYSQIDLHAEYGGIVPELASRAHLEKFPQLLRQLISDLEKVQLSLEDLSFVSVTMKPGLQGSLLIGYQVGLAIAGHCELPLIPIHHLEAHFYAVKAAGYEITYPFLGLLLSGGNSSIYQVEGLGKLEKVADTLDDAAGEAFDKAAALLGLPYPGGPSLDKLANSVGPLPASKNPLPIILKDQPGTKADFSFSGLKTALLYAIRNNPNADKAEFAYYFRQRIIELVRRNLKRRIKSSGTKRVIAAGGVMANPTLGNELQSLCAEQNVELIIPPRSLCTDNAVMVAALAHSYFIARLVPESFYVTSNNDFSWQTFRS